MSVIELEKHMATTSIFGIILGKLRHKKKPYLIILLKVNEGLKINFYHTILHFGLIVRLWIEGIGQFPLDAEEIA